MLRIFLVIIASLTLHSAGSADTLPHMRLDLPTTLEDLEARYASARKHITPDKDILAQARARYNSTISGALHPRADKWFRKGSAEAGTLREACATGDQSACAGLAHLYLDDVKTMPDEPLAYALSIMACDAGSDAACELFIDRNWSAYLTEYEPLFPATDHFFATCAEGNAAHCLRLGRIFSGHHAHRDVPEDDEKGLAFFRLACDLGEDVACKFIPAPVLSPAELFVSNLAKCDQGDALGCYASGRAYLYGKGTNKDVEMGLIFLDQACRKGRGCTFVASLFEQGKDIPADPVRAIDYRVLACDTGDKRSCDQLADAYLTGTSVTVDKSRARHFREKSCAIKACPEDSFSKALEDLRGPASLSHIPPRHHAEAPDAIARCAQNDAQACERLGVLLQRAQSTHARTLYQQACKLGAAEACIQTGRSISGAEALAYYQRACDMGTLRGCTWFAHMNRSLVPDDRLDMLEDLCADGEGQACGLLGRLSLGDDYTGLELPQNPDAAKEFYTRSCELGHLDGCTDLARMFDPENTKTGDHSRMMALLSETCTNGGAAACDMLGGKYLYSDLVTQDINQAHHFYRLACQIRLETDTCEDAERTRLAIERRDLRKNLGGFEAALAPRLQDFGLYFHAPARRMRAACAAGEQDQCLALAGLYQTYIALAHEGRDEDQARAIYLHLCDNGRNEACYRYGQSYQDQGHLSRHDISADYYSRACDTGHGEACTSLGLFYELGDDAVGSEDDNVAGKYYLKACGYGNARGCDYLSGLFDVPAKTKPVFDLIACLGGDGQACGFVADDYRKGRGGAPTDMILARALYDYGCSFGDEDACYYHRRFGDH